MVLLINLETCGGPITLVSCICGILMNGSITDPIGTVPQSPGGDYSSDYANLGYDNPTPPTIEYESKLTIIISYTSPTIMEDGSPLRPGILWWCPLTGKMYIYYDNTWVISTLISMQSTKWSLDEIITDDGVMIRPPIIILPEPIPDPDGGGCPRGRWW